MPPPGPFSATWFPRTLARLRALGYVLLLGLYGVFVWQHANIKPAGADASGYFNLARLIREGRLHEPARTIEGVPMSTVPAFTYCPLGFVPDEAHERLDPTYPPGLPLLFAAASALAGWDNGPHALMVLLSLAGVVLTYRLGRDIGASRPLAGLAAATIAFSPLYLAYSLQAMSDLPALVACTAALWLAPRASSRSALACGAMIGLAVLIRPTNLLLALPLGLALGRPGRRWWWVIAGGVPAAVVFGGINHALYGSAWSTGYGAVGEFFSAQWILASATNYARWIPAVLTPFVLLAFAAPWHRTASRRVIGFHATWIVALAAFYLPYYFTHREWWYLRFLLPAFPSLVALAALGAETTTTWLKQPLVRRALWAAAVLVISLNGKARWFNLGIREIGESGAHFVTLQQLVRDTLPANAVVLSLESSGVLYFSTTLCVVRWDALDDAWPRVRDGAARSGRPVYAALLAFEDEKRFLKRTPGNWRKIATRGLATLWQLSPDGAAAP